MHINKKILSLPPYISTSWANVKSLHMEGGALKIVLGSGESIVIPELKPEILEAIFAAHAAFLEHQPEQRSPAKKDVPQSIFGNDDMTFRFGFAGLDGIGTAMQHNPAQMNAPDIPFEVLEKISAIAKAVMPDDPNLIPKAEPHCNCMHCQIARAIHQEMAEEKPQEVLEEEIHDEDLAFCQWEIEPSGENLYTVTNRLESKEKYSVYIGHPVGCTCGKEGCEHIIAVLKS